MNLELILPYNITIDKIDENIKIKTLKERFYNAKNDINNVTSLKPHVQTIIFIIKH